MMTLNELEEAEVEESDKIAAAILSAAHFLAHPGETPEAGEGRLIAGYRSFLRAVATRREFEPVRLDAEVRRIDK
jgi:hypothetical protein